MYITCIFCIKKIKNKSFNLKNVKKDNKKLSRD